MERGIVALPGIIHGFSNGLHYERGLSDEEIRYYALYYDQVVIPTNNMIHLGIKDEDLLIEHGVIERPRIIMSSLGPSEQGSIFAKHQAVTAKKLTENDRTTQWSLHQFGGSLVLPNEWMESKKTLRFDLLNILPVPKGDIHIADILEFKERRRDEFEAIHEKIDSIYIEALKNPDSDLGASKAISEFKKIINDINKVSTETKWSLSSFDLAAELQLNGKDVLAGIAGGAAFSMFTGLVSVNLGSLLGATASCINIKASTNLSYNISSNQSPLAYLSNASKENIIKDD